MKVTVNVPEKLAEQARARGLGVAAYVEEVLAEQAQRFLEKHDATVVGEAIDGIVELRKGNTLGGLKIKDLIEEGRKY